MKKKSPLIRYGFAVIAWAILASFSGGAEEKPNIVLIYIDDWAWNGSPVPMHPDMPNSRMPVVKMPNFERLANQGMKFSNAYGSPQCSPGRACVLTGQTSARNGFTVYLNPRGQDYYNVSKGYEGFKVVPCIATEELDPETTLGIPKALAPLGYVSAHVGKWHLRGDPGDHGYLLHDGNTDNKPGNTLTANLKPGEEKPRRLPNDFTDPKLMFSITDKAIGFMEEQVEAERPFYLQISHYAMHEGRECLPATREKYINDPYVQAYYALIGKTVDTVNIKEDPAIWLGMAEDMDGQVGAVLDKIDELGIADRTYVVMVSDNGYRHSFLPELTQPLHAQKWWVWEGGIRVPMIIKGPGIEQGSQFTGNVVNYDFLPTFVDWAGGDPSKLEKVDGVSLASYLEGEEPGTSFLSRNLHFHYPHYRTTMPHTAIISGNQKLLHFWGYEDVPMLFDLSQDIGEARNVAAENPDDHAKLFDDMMDYLDEVGARIPKVNPDYDPVKYRASQDYWYRVNWGPFQGNRSLDDDERVPTLQLSKASVTLTNDDPQIEFANLKDGDRLPVGSELRVELEATDADGIDAVKLYLNGLLLNAQGKTKAPTVWSGAGDHLLQDLKPGTYHLEAVVTDETERTVRREIQVAVGNDPGNSQSADEEIYRIVLDEGEKIMADRVIKFPRLEALLKLERNGKLLLRDDLKGKLFAVESNGGKGDYHATLEKGQLKIYSGKTRDTKTVIWESPNPEAGGASQLGITTDKKLVIFRKAEDSEIEVLWKSH